MWGVREETTSSTYPSPTQDYNRRALRKMRDTAAFISRGRQSHTHRLCRNGALSTALQSLTRCERREIRRICRLTVSSFTHRAVDERFARPAPAPFINKICGKHLACSKRVRTTSQPTMSAEKGVCPSCLLWLTDSCPGPSQEHSSLLDLRVCLRLHQHLRVASRSRVRRFSALARQPSSVYLGPCSELS